MWNEQQIWDVRSQNKEGGKKDKVTIHRQKKKAWGNNYFCFLYRGYSTCVPQ